MTREEAKSLLKSLPGDAIVAVMKTDVDGKDMLSLSITCTIKGEPLSHIGALTNEPILKQFEDLRREFLDNLQNHEKK